MYSGHWWYSSAGTCAAGYWRSDPTLWTWPASVGKATLNAHRFPQTKVGQRVQNLAPTSGFQRCTHTLLANTAEGCVWRCWTHWSGRVFRNYQTASWNLDIWSRTDWCHRWRNRPRSFQLLFGPRTPLGKAWWHSGKRSECATDVLFHLNEEFETLLNHTLGPPATQVRTSCVTRDLVDKAESSCFVPFIVELSDPDVQLVRLGSQVAKIELETLNGTWPGGSQPFRLQPGWISLCTHGCARVHEVSHTWSWNDWKICVRWGGEWLVGGWGVLEINLK